MVSDKFSRDLRKEASLWQAEGLIDRAVYEQLAERYQFDSLESVARNLFVTILLGLSGILMGLGALAFVAANWQEWSPGMKLMLMLGFCVGANGAGFYLWRSPMEKRQRLGQGGANFGSAAGADVSDVPSKRTILSAIANLGTGSASNGL